MMRCEQCRPLILDHLYGLLEGPEAAVVESHLRECAACAAARDEEGRLQGLFAQAAKTAFPEVRFEPPAAKPRIPVAQTPSSPTRSLALPTPSASTTTPARTPTTTPRHSAAIAPWLPWAIAAAVLVAIPGTVFPVLSLFNDAKLAREQADAAVARLDHTRQVADTAGNRLAETRRSLQLAQVEIARPRVEAERRLLAARQTHDSLLQKWAAEEKATLQTLAARKTTVDVVKPASVQPGAPNEFLLVVRDRGTGGGRILAEIRDQTDAVIYAQKFDVERHDDTHPIRLPASAWSNLTPQSELFLVVSREDDLTGAKTELQDRIRLLGPVYATMLTTDKAEYRPGDTLYFRSLTLDRVSFRPPTRDQILHYELRGRNNQLVRPALVGDTNLVRVVGQKVEPLVGPDGKTIRGVGTGEFALPADLPDGEYTLTLTELPHPAGYPPCTPLPVTRSIKVRSGVASASRKQIGYSAASYSVSDTVEAWAELRFEDKPVQGAEVRAVATADDLVLNDVNVEPVTGANGRANIRFKLPPELDRGDVRLKVTFKTRAGEETVADRVPVVGRNVVVEFFPEGGELIAGVPCRVYVRATTPTGQPVDIRGVVTDGRETLAQIATLTDPGQPGVNRGIGAFTFTPKLGTPVWLKLQSPASAYSPLLEGPLPVAPGAVAGYAAVAGNRTGFVLPKPVREGVAMTVPNPVTAPGQPIRVHLRSVGKDRNLVVGAYTRGQLSDTQTVKAEVGKLAEVRLMAGTDPRGGVVRITVFEVPEEQDRKPGDPAPDLKPMAERLVFRKPGEALELSYTTVGTREAGTPLDLNITATDEKGNPAAAILYAAVVNTGVAPGHQDRLLTTHFLLAGEISTPDAMEHADFLLTAHPNAAESLDLVLATQGWRRFVEQIQPGFARRPLARTVETSVQLANNGQYPVMGEPPGLRESRKLYETFWPRFEAAAKALEEAQRAVEFATALPVDETPVRELAAVADRLSAEQLAAAAAIAPQVAEARAAVNRVAENTAPLERFRGAGWYGVAGFALLAVMLGAAALTGAKGRLPLGIGTAGSFGLVAFLLAALGMAERAQATAQAQHELVIAQHIVPDGATPAADVSLGLEVGPTPRFAAPTNTLKTNGMDTAAWDGQRPGVPPRDQPGIPGFAGGGAKGPNAPTMPPAAGSGAPASDAKLPLRGGALPTGAGGGGGLGGTPPGFGGLPGGMFQIPPIPMLPGGLVLPTPTPPESALPLLPGGPAITANPMNSAKLVAADGNTGWQPSTGRPLVTDDELARDRDELARKRRGAEPVRSFSEAAAKNEMEMLHAIEQAKGYAVNRAKVMKNQLHEAVGNPKEFFAPMPRPSGNPGGGFGSAAKGGGKMAEPRLDAFAFSRIRAAIPTTTPLVVREYAAPRPRMSESGLGGEPDTILWQPLIVLPGDGKASVTFHLGSAPGGYQVVIAGHTLDGRIGAIKRVIPVAGPVQSESGPPVPPPGGVKPGNR